MTGKLPYFFYIAVHCLKALAAKEGVSLGKSHQSVDDSVNPDSPTAVMPFDRKIYKKYRDLKKYSRIARYDGIIDLDEDTFEIVQKETHKQCVNLVIAFQDYIISRGVPLE
ncbi:MAG: hypothetical protein SFW35_10965 [Chitinophagales bacterium]|nr:hypothetical protein [Chitinophagales bacterium]